MSKREFELDLTSVCVGSGVVQLPLRMQSLFVAGDLPAVIDGEDVLLSFVEPRRLSGFRAHFEKRGLRSNDKVRFEVEVDGERVTGLVAWSVKRERNKPAQQRLQADQGSADAVTAANSEVVSAYPQGSSWGDSDGGSQVRAVRRVRIEGGTPDPVSPATNNFLAPARSAGMRAGDARVLAGASVGVRATWAPLDGLSSDNDDGQRGLVDYPETTVREVRRNKSAPTFNNDFHHPEPQSSEQETTWTPPASHAPPLYAGGSEVVEDQLAEALEAADFKTAPPLDTAPSASQVVSEPTGETTTAPASPPVSHHVHAAPPRIPVTRNTAAGANWQPTPAAGLDVARAPVQPRLIEETDLNPRRNTPEAPFQHEAAPRRVEDRPANGSQYLNRQPAQHAIDDAEFGGDYLPSGRSFDNAMRQHGLTDPASAPSASGQAAASSNSNTGAAAAVATSSSTTTLPLPEVRATAPVRLEDDLRMVQAYLDRPNTPAIVRSEVVAAELGIDDQRSERALERLSENRERVSRIRKGAYMVKRMPAGHASRF